MGNNINTNPGWEVVHWMQLVQSNEVCGVTKGRVPWRIHIKISKDALRTNLSRDTKLSSYQITNSLRIHTIQNRDGSVCTASWLRLGRPQNRVRYPAGQSHFSLPQRPQMLLGPPRLLYKGCFLGGWSSRGVKLATRLQCSALTCHIHPWRSAWSSKSHNLRVL